MNTIDGLSATLTATIGRGVVATNVECITSPSTGKLAAIRDLAGAAGTWTLASLNSVKCIAQLIVNMTKGFNSTVAFVQTYPKLVGGGVLIAITIVGGARYYNSSYYQGRKNREQAAQNHTETVQQTANNQAQNHQDAQEQRVELHVANNLVAQAMEETGEYRAATLTLHDVQHRQNAELQVSIHQERENRKDARHRDHENHEEARHRDNLTVKLLQVLVDCPPEKEAQVYKVIKNMADVAGVGSAFAGIRPLALENSDNGLPRITSPPAIPLDGDSDVSDDASSEVAPSRD